MTSSHCMLRKPWDLAFAADARELSTLRRITRLHLRYWGLHHLIDAAELCVTEMVANVITHVGEGTPTSLRLSLNGVLLRIEVEDPCLRVLPTLLVAADDSETGRGMAIVSAVTDRWGVLIKGDRKVTWCELTTGLESPGGHMSGPSVRRAEALLALYGEIELLRNGVAHETAIARGTTNGQTAVEVIADVLSWVCAHGLDPDEVLDGAQNLFAMAAGHAG